MTEKDPEVQQFLRLLLEMLRQREEAKRAASQGMSLDSNRSTKAHFELLAGPLTHIHQAIVAQQTLSD